jgi:hypothetical protein
MKVKLGPYLDYWGPYQLAELLQKVGVSEDRCHNIGTWLSDHTPLGRVCQWLYDRRQRQISVQIDRWDTWSMDHTLSHIILPMLRQLQATKHGAPFVDDQDVPAGQGLRSTEAPPKANEWDTDENHFKRWDWVLNEEIWAFEQIATYKDDGMDFYNFDAHNGLAPWDEGYDSSLTQYDRKGHEAYQARLTHALHLFGKYFRAHWD